MLALQLGMLEQFGRWDCADRQRLQQAIPHMAAGLERVQRQAHALADWLHRLEAIVEQDLAQPSRCSEPESSPPEVGLVKTSSTAESGAL